MISIRSRLFPLYVFLIVLFAAILPGCVGSSQSGDALQRVKSRGVLRVGTTGDYCPMSYLNPATKAYEGFDAALAEDLASSLGIEIQYIPATWPTLMQDTLDRKFDLAICNAL